jgi:hypothetical protein
VTNRWVAYTVWITGQRDDSIPGRKEQDGKRFHHTTQNGVQFETYELLEYYSAMKRNEIMLFAGNE